MATWHMRTNQNAIPNKAFEMLPFVRCSTEYKINVLKNFIKYLQKRNYDGVLFCKRIHYRSISVNLAKVSEEVYME